MSLTKPTAAYWDEKLSVYLHDPFTKSFRIQGHEQVANEILNVMGLSLPDKDVYKAADQIASGMDRAQVPGFDRDPQKNGAIDFTTTARLTHPTGKNGSLPVRLPEKLQNVTPAAVAQLNQEVMHFLNSANSIGSQADQGSLSDQFKEDPEKFAYVRFTYVHLLLRHELTRHNISQIGPLWARLPADTRIPDHSIWQHNGLVSALHSSMRESRDHKAALMVYSLTPVQGFIARARKLRDYWTGSVILSWLAFCGIRAVMEYLGADHILYPSLIDQPLVENYCDHQFDQWEKLEHNKHANKSIASFPNKFVCLVPKGKEQDCAETIRESINGAWRGLTEETLTFLKQVTRQDHCYLQKLFDRQSKSFWEHQWASTPLLSKKEADLCEELLGKERTQKDLEFMKKNVQFSKDRYGSYDEGFSALYGLSHKLAQSGLASIKSCKFDERTCEPGIKCQQCGEFEIVTVQPGENPSSKETVQPDENPSLKKDIFWCQLRKNWQKRYNATDFKVTERLCSICLTKRIAYQVCEENQPNSLSSLMQLKYILTREKSFASSTDVALSDMFDFAETQNIIDKEQRKKLAQYIHQREGGTQEEKVNEERLLEKERYKLFADLKEKNRPYTEADNYYAILLMDGDHMGKLVNGETVASTWMSVLHPDLAKRLDSPEFDTDFKEYWESQKLLSQRRLAPALHASISESLGDFSIYGVPAIIKRHRGYLIYAGGDDVCAVMPVSSVLAAAEEIAKLYCAGFVGYKNASREQTGNHEIFNGSIPLNVQNSEFQKLSVHLGKGFSISAGIHICHHKKPLTTALQRAHQLLDDEAKRKTERNAVAIELDKRSGGSRVYSSKWEGSDSTLEDFKSIGNALGKDSRDLSSSLAYRLETFKEGLISISESENSSKRMANFIAAQMDRSEVTFAADPNLSKEEQKKALAQSIVCVIRKSEGVLAFESLIVAKFLGERVWRREQDDKKIEQKKGEQ